MTFEQNMHIIMMLIKKGHNTAVIEAISSLTNGNIQTYVSQKRLFGINIKEEQELIICIAHSERSDEIFTMAIEAGKPNTPGNGICTSISADKMYTNINDENPNTSQVHPPN